jgi:hypothetical protein
MSEKKTEAIACMKLIGIYSETIRQFEREDLVSVSEPPFGAIFWLNDEQRERVRKFEQEHNALVYHVIHSFTNFGELENYLFVSNYQEEWEYERESLSAKEKETLAYVNNLSMPDFSEFGTIGIELLPTGGLKRKW